MTGPEASIERAVVRWAKDHGALVLKQGGANNSRGVPDRLFLYRSSACFIEFKRPGAKPTALQFKWIERLRDQGVAATWFDDAEAAKTWLSKKLFGLG